MRKRKNLKLGASGNPIIMSDRVRKILSNPVEAKKLADAIRKARKE
jgi:hypothetical protein